MPYPIILYFVADVPDFSLLLLLSGLAYLFFTCFTSLNAAFSEDDDIDVIEKKLEELLRLEAKIKADFSRGSITEEHYRQSMTRLLAVREKLEAKMEDTIVAMMSPDKTAPQAPVVVSDPLAYTNMQNEEDDQKPTHDDGEPLVKVMEVKRGVINGVRGLEVKFLFHDNKGKAIIDSNDGQWHFNAMKDTLYHGQFIIGLQKSMRFAEVFEKEVSRHPEDWHEVISEGKPYTKGGKEKNTRDSFPPVCREIMSRYAALISDDPSHKTTSGKTGFVDLTGEPVIISKVECGQYTKVERKDFGKGFLEFPRYILVLLDWGKYRLKAEFTTDIGRWEVVPRDPSHDYPMDLLPEFKQVIPFMMQELDQPRNKYLANTVLSEMRRKEERHQWEPIVTESSSLSWPHECRKLFQIDND